MLIELELENKKHWAHHDVRNSMILLWLTLGHKVTPSGQVSDLWEENIIDANFMTTIYTKITESKTEN